MTISQGAFAPVTLLPTAAPFPVSNPRWRGRYPANVVRMRTTIRVGDVVRIATDLNPNKVCRVIHTRGSEIYVQPLNGLLNFSDGTTGPEGWVDRKSARRVLAPTHSEEKFSLPAWPRRWEQAFASSTSSN